MAFVVEALLLLVVFCILYMYNERSKRKSMPPGEWGLPLIGYERQSNETMGQAIKRLQKKHGDVFTWKMGSRTYVYLCKLETMKKVFNGPDVNVRPEFFSFKNFTDGKVVGIFNTSGDMWSTTRRFAMKSLKDLGLGKSSMEDAVAYETKCLIDDFRKRVGKPTEIPITMGVAILNVIWKMISDLRYDLDDPLIMKFQGMLVDIFEEFQGNIMYFDAYPILEKIVPKMAYQMLGVKSYIDKSKALITYLHKVVSDHEKTLDVNNPRDLIDEFIIEIKRQGHSNKAFSEDNLKGAIADLFSNGSESTASTIKWIILYLAKYPEVQKKVQKEIDEVVPRDRLPGTEHQSRLSYTEAVFHEVQRLVSLIPYTFPRTCDHTIEIDGYKIPKDTIIIGDVEGMHMNPEYWERPNEFYPEHFLDSNGKFKNKKDGYAPFSIGRRICPGESLAKINIFMFGSALFQNFDFGPAPGEKLSTERDPDQPLVIMPKRFKIIMTNRK